MSAPIRASAAVASSASSAYLWRRGRPGEVQAGDQQGAPEQAGQLALEGGGGGARPGGGGGGAAQRHALRYDREDVGVDSERGGGCEAIVVTTVLGQHRVGGGPAPGGPGEGLTEHGGLSLGPPAALAPGTAELQLGRVPRPGRLAEGCG